MSLALKQVFSFIILSLSLGLLFLGLIQVLPVQAQGLAEQQVGLNGAGNAYNVSTGSEVDVRTYVANIIKVFLTFLALIFTIVIILGGYKWMTAGGNDDKVKQAKSQIKNGIIGFVLILIAYVIVDLTVNIINDEILDG